MLKLCVLFGLTVGVFFLQIYSQTNPAKNDATDLLNILKKIINEYLEKTKPVIDAMATKVESTAGSVHNQAETAIAAIEDGFKDQLNAVKNMAADVDVNIDQCLVENEEKLMEMPRIFSTNLLTNMSYKVMEGVSYAIETRQKVKHNNEIAHFKQELADCDGDVSSTDCLDKLSNKIQETIILLSNRINKYIRKGQVLSDEACVRIEEYASNLLRDLESEGGALVNTIFECMGNIIN